LAALYKILEKAERKADSDGYRFRGHTTGGNGYSVFEDSGLYLILFAGAVGEAVAGIPSIFLFYVT